MSRAGAVAAWLAALGAVAAAGETRTTDETAKLVTYLAQEFNYGILTVAATPTRRLEEIVADDVVVVWSNGERSTGKAECLQRIAKSREAARELLQSFAISYELQKVRVVGDAAIILAKVTLIGTLAENEKPFRREVWQTLVFARSDDRWRLVHEHSNQLAAPKPEGPKQRDVPQ